MNCPNQRSARSPLTGKQIAAAAYEGSPEHKVKRWWGGLPKARLGRDGKAVPRPKRQKTTICHLVEADDRDRATSWVQHALRAGNFKHGESRKAYPERIYHRDESGRCWEGHVINAEQGNYKGWPIPEERYHAAMRKLGRR